MQINLLPRKTRKRKKVGSGEKKFVLNILVNQCVACLDKKSCKK